MNAKQRAFWGPYISKIGAKNFFSNGMIIQSKHYCGMDISQAEGAEQFATHQRDMIIRRHDEYKALISKEILSLDDLETVFMLVEKQFYDEEFVQLINNDKLGVSDEEYWDIVQQIWVRQEFNSGGNRKRNWKRIFKHRPKLASLSAELPDEFRAYRAGKEDGFSWTLDRSKAEWFHNRFKMQFGNIPFLEKTFKRDDVIFYTNIRNEKEVVILPQTRRN